MAVKKEKDLVVPSKDEESEAPKRKRVTLTPAEKIAKAEAELAAIKAKVQKHDADKADKLRDEIAKVDDKIVELTSKRDAFQAELDIIAARLQG